MAPSTCMRNLRDGCYSTGLPPAHREQRFLGLHFSRQGEGGIFQKQLNMGFYEINIQRRGTFKKKDEGR